MTGLHEWRGLKKYLRVEVEGTPKITRNPNDLIREDYNFLNTEKLHDNILFPIHVKVVTGSLLMTIIQNLIIRLII